MSASRLAALLLLAGLPSAAALAAPGSPMTPGQASLAGPARPSAPAMAATPVTDDTEDVEPVEDVMAVTAAPGPGTPGGQGAPGAAPKPAEKRGLAQIFGRLHPAFVHFPIAWLVLLLLIDIRTLGWRRPGWERLGLYVLGLTLASMALAVVSGFLRADQLPRAPDTTKLILAHRNLALVTAAVTAAAFALRLARRNRLEGAFRWAYLGLLAAATGLVLLAGHRGAALVFGADFLPF